MTTLDVRLVSHLISSQFPEWSALQISAVELVVSQFEIRRLKV